ncbi:hypothetical protein EC991_007643 [Linnemannia zychae]|nr:hypothetical protein EC991_007643 [Linnemannia zychae]
MTPQDTPSNVQAVRRIDENANSSNIIHLVCHSDPSSGKDIILWEDIITAFKTNDVIHVRSGTVVLPFLKGADFKSLEPLRIAAVHGVTLDVVIGGQLSQKELSMVSLQESLPDTAQMIGTATNSNTTTTTITTVTTALRRNPAGGLVEAAMDAYRNNENPAFGPKLRGPQALVDETSSSSISDTRPTPQKPISSSETPSPQRSGSVDSSSFHETMKKAKLGDMNAQHALGEMYYYARGGVQQDYNAAMEWYTKAAIQGHAKAQNDIGYMYDVGLGVSRDYDRAMIWYRKASDQGSASAQYNIGDLYEKGLGVTQDYSAAMEWYQKAASKGHAHAFSNIGFLYSRGLGVPQSYPLAMEWYRKAADQGLSSAQFNVGVMFETGRGVPIDIAAAKEWYRRAAAGGFTRAKEYLDDLEHNGEEQKQTTPEVKKKMTPQEAHSSTQAVHRADENGNSSSSSNITHLVCHSEPSSGEDIIRWEDIITAFKTNNVIHVQSGTLVLSLQKLGLNSIAAVPEATSGVIVGDQLSEEELSMVSLQETLPDTLLNFGSLTNPNATTTITAATAATVRRNPVGGSVETAMGAYSNNENPALGPRSRGPQAPVEEISLDPTSDSLPTPQMPMSSTETPLLQSSTFANSNDFRVTMKLAKLGDRSAYYTLGDMYYNATGVQQDYKVAMYWYTKAADRGHMGAQYSIGAMHENGVGVPQDYHQAMKWYQEAANEGFLMAQHAIGTMYRYGRGVTQDESLAMDWFHKADKLGSIVAPFNLGCMYENGEGVEIDLARALNFYMKAAERGNNNAKKSVARLNVSSYIPS